MPSLLRLFPEDKTRFSTTLDAMIPNAEQKGIQPPDPWRPLMELASKSKEGLLRSLQCLCVFACSGVDIPISAFFQFSSLVTNFGVSLADSLLFVETAFFSTYLKSLGRQDLQAILSALHSRLAPHVMHCLRTKNDLHQV
jgi:hypothetical protein